MKFIFNNTVVCSSFLEAAASVSRSGPQTCLSFSGLGIKTPTPNLPSIFSVFISKIIPLLVLFVILPAALAADDLQEYQQKTAWTEEAAENAVIKAYRSVLGRDPDRVGLDDHISHLIGNSGSKAWLVGTLQKSEEYRRKKALEAKRTKRAVATVFIAVYLLFLCVIPPQEKHCRSAKAAGVRRTACVRKIDAVWRFCRRHRALLMLIVFCALLIGPRMGHLTGPIVGPHAWRQCDTAWYAYSFHNEGIDMFRPSVCWMGNHKTVIFEFPLPELIMAVAYNVWGHHLFLARLVTLLFFAGSALYLYLLVRELVDTRIAAISTSVYLILPLSIFYSIAVHIDFFAVFFAHAMAFHLVRALRRPRSRDIALGATAGSLAFLIKAPYAFYFVLPLMLLAVQNKRPWRSLLALGSYLLLPIMFFILWRMHVVGVNAEMPDWYFIPEYFKFVDRGWWYYGDLSERFIHRNWMILLIRFKNDVVSHVGYWIFPVGLAVAMIFGFRGHWRKMAAIWLWFTGVLLYIIIFYNLNVRHDYYQIPLLGVSSVFIALAIDAPHRLLRRHFPKMEVALVLIVYALLAIESIAHAKSIYFKPDPIGDRFGKIVREHTDEEALLIAAPHFGANWENPRALFNARRYGWSVNRPNLSTELVERLRQKGATHLAVVSDDAAELENIVSYGYAYVIYPIDENWRVLIADLDKRPARAEKTEEKDPGTCE